MERIRTSAIFKEELVPSSRRLRKDCEICYALTLINRGWHVVSSICGPPTPHQRLQRIVYLESQTHKLSGRNKLPKGPFLIASIVPGSKSTQIARGTLGNECKGSQVPKLMSGEDEEKPETKAIADVSVRLAGLSR